MLRLMPHVTSEILRVCRFLNRSDRSVRSHLLDWTGPVGPRDRDGSDRSVLEIQLDRVEPMFFIHVTGVIRSTQVLFRSTLSFFLIYVSLSGYTRLWSVRLIGPSFFRDRSEIGSVQVQSPIRPVRLHLQKSRTHWTGLGRDRTEGVHRNLSSDVVAMLSSSVIHFVAESLSH